MLVISGRVICIQRPATSSTMSSRGWYRFTVIGIALLVILFADLKVDSFLQPRIITSRMHHKHTFSRQPTSRFSPSCLSANPKSSPSMATDDDDEVNDDDDDDTEDDDDDSSSWASFFEPKSPQSAAVADGMGLREGDFNQNRDLDLILTERAERFYDPKLVGIEKEKCILVAVDTKLEERRTALSVKMGKDNGPVFSLQESLQELSELVGTAGLQVMASCVQRRYSPHTRTYVGPGKVVDIMAAVNATRARTLVIDDDLSTRQQRNLEDSLALHGGKDVKVLDRTAVILEIFAQHAQSREGQLQVELAMLEYRLTRGPRASGDLDGDKGCGFRGPGETKLETDKRQIREKIVLLGREIGLLGMQREQHRKSRARLGLPVVALVGYTNAGKSSLLNRLSRAGVLAENMLFATLDPTTRRIRLPRSGGGKSREGLVGGNAADGEGGGEGGGEDVPPILEANLAGVRNKGQEVLLTDTVGFISKLPTDLIAAFRATLEEVSRADVLIHVIDRSSPVWDKQRETVLRELDAMGCGGTPVIELWNKIDGMGDPEGVREEAVCVPVEVEAVVREWEGEGEVELGVLGDGGEGVGVGVEGVEEMVETEEETVVVVYGVGMPGVVELQGSAELEEDDDEDDNGYVIALPDGGFDLSTPSTPSTRSTPSTLSIMSSPSTFSTPPPPTPRSTRKKSKTVIRPARKTFTVAASVKTGLGFDDFLESLESALSLLLKPISVFVPVRAWWVRDASFHCYHHSPYYHHSPHLPLLSPLTPPTTVITTHPTPPHHHSPYYHHSPHLPLLSPFTLLSPLTPPTLTPPTTVITTHPTYTHPTHHCYHHSPHLPLLSPFTLLSPLTPPTLTPPTTVITTHPTYHCYHHSPHPPPSSTRTMA